MSKTNKDQSPQFSVLELATITEAVKQANEYSSKQIGEKFNNISWLVVGVVFVVFIAFIQMIVSLFQINNAAYKDYSQKLEERIQILNDYKQQLVINEKLLQQIATKSAEKQ